jgi:hypothetical protein
MFSDLYELANEYDKRLPEMEDRFNSLDSRYKKLRRVADASVTTWQWTALPRYELEPFFFELGSVRRGRVMRGQPEKIAGRHQYGFSSDQSLVVERQHSEFPDRYYETFFTYNGNEIAQDHYSYDKGKSPINTTRMFSESIAHMCLQKWATMGNSQVVYKLSQGRIIAQLAIYRRFGNGDSFGGLHTMEYSSEDVIKIWAMSSNGHRSLSYEGAIASNPSIDEVVKRLRPSPAPRAKL